MYIDPRFGFPVFLFGEQSQIVREPTSFPSNTDLHRAEFRTKEVIEGIKYVNTIIH